MPIERGGVSKDSENQAGKVLRWFLLVLGGALLVFIMIWMAMRINYKLYEVRNNFFPILLGIGGGILLIACIFLFAIRCANMYGKNKEKEEKESKKYSK